MRERGLQLLDALGEQLPEGPPEHGGAPGAERASGMGVDDGGPQVDVPLLDVALTRANNGNARREDVLRIVLALAEGVRFMSVERAVRGHLPISTQMVDWGQQLAANDAVLRQG